MTTGVYIIKNKNNNKVYIGSSVNIEHRWIQHRSGLRNKEHHSIHLQRAWDKHGEDSFEFSILTVTSTDDLIKSEQEAIDSHKSFKMNSGYNISPIAGSCLGVKHSEDFKKACSERGKKRYLDPIERAKTGQKSKEGWTDEIRENVSKRMTEVWSDPEQKKIRSELTSIGASRPDRVDKRSRRMKEKWKSEEARAKQALACPHRKRIQHIETGKIYESISEACRLLPVSVQTIKNNLLGKFKSAKGMNFKYVD